MDLNIVTPTNVDIDVAYQNFISGGIPSQKRDIKHSKVISSYHV